MFKVLLVDDEPPIMRTLKKTVENADPDFVVGGCCMNGKSAVEALEKESFDIVITDIKMPVMTGLELAEWIYNNKRGTMVILLSGYQDFEYARSALEYKVFDYLLKPISAEKVAELFARIKADRNKAEKTEPCAEENTVVILACAGAYLLYGTDVLRPGEHFWADDTMEEFMKQYLLPDEAYMFFNSASQSECFVVVSAENTARQESIVREMYRVLSGSLPLTILYKTGIRFKEAGGTFPYLREQLIKRLILNRSQLIACDGAEDVFDNMAQPYSKEDIELITVAIRHGSEEGVRDSLKKIILSMRDNDCTQEDIISLLNVVLDTYTLNYPGKLRRKNSSVKREVITAIAGFTSYDAFLEDIQSIFMTLKTDESNADRYGKLADEVEEFIKENFNKNITNETLSKTFGFVPSYISRIFKRKHGITPSEYITQYRVNAAKKILLENPQLMVKEVANMTGFKEAYYFSKTFKRETGLWPTEYANRRRTE